MKAKCRHCGWPWGVSILQEIPKDGYECPICTTELKRARRRWQSPYRQLTKIS